MHIKKAIRQSWRHTVKQIVPHWLFRRLSDNKHVPLVNMQGDCSEIVCGWLEASHYARALATALGDSRLSNTGNSFRHMKKVDENEFTQFKSLYATGIIYLHSIDKKAS